IRRGAAVIATAAVITAATVVTAAAVVTTTAVVTAAAVITTAAVVTTAGATWIVGGRACRTVSSSAGTTAESGKPERKAGECEEAENSREALHCGNRRLMKSRGGLPRAYQQLWFHSLPGPVFLNKPW